MMTSPRNFLLKIIRVRETLMRKNLCQRSILKSSMAIRAIKPWLEAHPKATDAQVLAFITRRYEAVMYIIPGGKTPTSLAFLNELNQIITNHVSSQTIPQAFAQS